MDQIILLILNIAWCAVILAVLVQEILSPMQNKVLHWLFVGGIGTVFVIYIIDLIKDFPTIVPF